MSDNYTDGRVSARQTLNETLADQSIWESTEPANVPENFRVGTEVLDKAGRRGIVTDEVRKSGINKGRVAVHWIGASYAVSEYPADLLPVPEPRVYTRAEIVNGTGWAPGVRFRVETDPRS